MIVKGSKLPLRAALSTALSLALHASRLYAAAATWRSRR
jgi:hypothetical protein